MNCVFIVFNFVQRFFYIYHSAMLSLLQPKVNGTAVLYMLPHERMLFGMLCVGSICSFLYINCVLLFTLRSKQVFCETSRYILLYNLLFADTAHLATNLVLYFQSILHTKMPYYVCGIIVLLSVLTQSISPLTLAVMSLERYVAVCHPLRHAAIFTVRSTGIAIAVVWAFSFIHIIIRVLMLVYVFSKISLSLHVNADCSKEALFFAPIFHDFEKGHVGTLFLSVGAVMIGSYIGVVLVARSASTDKESAKKTLQTLLLHLIQLSLILTASLFSTIIIAIARTVKRSVLMQIYNVCFVCLNILPRCLSTLIYGLRDQTIRPILMKNLCCLWRCPMFLKKS